MSSIYVIDDHPLYREGLAHLLRFVRRKSQVVAFGCAREALEAVPGAPDLHLVVLDQQLPGLSGVEAIRRFRQACPACPIAVVTESEDRIEAMAALRAGATMVLSKAIDPQRMAEAFRDVVCGHPPPGTWISQAAPASHTDHMPLTQRQGQVLALVVEGYSNKEIALRLDLAEITIKIHVSKLLRALHVASRARAIVAARQRGLV